MKKTAFCIIITIIMAAAFGGCSSLSGILSLPSFIADQISTDILSETDPEDAGGTDGESPFDPSAGSGTDDGSQNGLLPEGSDSSEGGDASDPKNSAEILKELLDSGTATIGDLKAMKLTSLKSSPSLLYDLFLNNDIPRNDYNNKLFRHEGSLMYYDDPEMNCELGIDVSFFQGEIDWEAVKAQGISFAFIRIGFRGYGESGSLNEDPLFRENLEGAKQAGLKVGAYFFSQAVNESEAEEEAAYALSLLDGADLDLPLVFDAEFIKEDDTRLDDVLLSQFTQNALAFCHAAESAGYDPMIYTNLLWEGLIYDLDTLSAYPIWYADYNPLPLTPYHFDFWQYTETGRLDGVEEPVDLNIWMKP